MADKEDENDSTEDANPGNPLSSSLSEVLKSPDFIPNMAQALLPVIVGGVKHSLNSSAKAHGESSVFD